MANRLADETSPYLLQHKDNPVDWHPWGEEALSKAKSDDLPILLSVGYSACHWCHVMERESFEDEGIASLMNQHFVNIKVDREERPDIDGIYMQAVQAMTGRGGWPMTVFLLPDGTPFYGGTYYPPEDRQGMPGFPRVLGAVAEAYRERRGALEETGRQLVERLSPPGEASDPAALLSDEIIHGAVAGLRGRFDAGYGGFGDAPKFPMPMDLDLLLRYQHRFGDRGALEIALKTLRSMANGGIYDQVGGGFARYSTDREWLVPHFEKMLYDNAQLAGLYLDAYLVTRDAFFARVATETLNYVLREMTHETGAFYSTQDADSEGEEGKFYVWARDEIAGALRDAPPPVRDGMDPASLVCEFYGVTEEGNFEGRNILHVGRDPAAFAAEHGLGEDELMALLDQAKTPLYEARERRVHPGRDEKVLASWNGMMLKAFARASRILDDTEGRYLDAARRNADFLIASMRPQGRLLRTWKDGQAKLLGYLEDYACVIDGLVAAYEATFEPRYLASSLELADEMLTLFWEPEGSVFYDTATDHEELVTRPRDVFDNATPAGNSVAVDVLLRLAELASRQDYEKVASAALRGLSRYLQELPAGFGRLFCALDFYLGRKQELALIADQGDAADALLGVVYGAYRPYLVVAGGRPDPELARLTPLLEARGTVDERPTAYVCENYACQAPVTEPAELAAQLR
ncbi:MAG: DUF255 domain-containing protein [Dehalococcoidia bacterium]|nr:DUF255 domain-containing protein [Dehalococcoidia bacterium]